MDRYHLPVALAYIASHREPCAQLDAAIRGQRGPRGVPTIALFAGFIYNLLDHQAPTIAAVWHLYEFKMTPTVRRQFGLTTTNVPSVSAFYRTMSRLERAIRAGTLNEIDTIDPRLVAIFAAPDEATRRAALGALIVSETAPPPAEEALYSADTTYIDARCSPISRERFDLGERASDPDASGRRIKRPNGEEKKTFGYAISTVVRSQGDHEYIDALRVDTASAHDRPHVVDMVEQLVADGVGITELAVDRGIKSQVLNAEIRTLGVEPIFDYDGNEGGYEGSYRGLPIVGGWLYSPALPERLRRPLPKPMAGRDKDELAERVRLWTADVDEQERYAWRVRQYLGPGRVQLYPPTAVGCHHPDLRHTMRTRDPGLATCPGEHGADEACALSTLVWGAERAPMSWQVPQRGSHQWRAKYKERSSVERGYSLVKNPDLINLKDKAIHLHGSVKFTAVVALAYAATNLHLARLPSSRTKGERAVPKPKDRAA